MPPNQNDRVRKRCKGEGARNAIERGQKTASRPPPNLDGDDDDITAKDLIKANFPAKPDHHAALRKCPYRMRYLSSLSGAHLAAYFTSPAQTDYPCVCEDMSRLLLEMLAFLVEYRARKKGLYVVW